jgi:hypothetical protein
MQNSLIKTLALGAVLSSPLCFAATNLMPSLTDGIQPIDCAKQDARKNGRCKVHAKKKVFETFKNVPVDTKLPETARVDATAGVFI